MEEYKRLENLTDTEINELKKYDESFFKNIMKQTKEKIEKELEEIEEEYPKPISRELLTKPFERVK